MPKHKLMSMETTQVVLSGLAGAARGATLTSAASIASGAALVSKPVTIPILFWEVAVGTSTAVAAGTVGMFALGGAALGFGGAALFRHLRNKRIHREFAELTGEIKGNSKPHHGT